MRKPFNKVKKAYLAILLIVCVSEGLFVSCKKSQPSWDTNILAPVIYTTLSMNNLVADSLVKQNPDTSLSLVYNGTIYDLNTDTLIKMPDTTSLYAYTNLSSGTLSVGAGQNIISNTNSATYGLGAVELKTATIQSGFIDIQILSHVNQPTDLRYKIPCATLNSVPFAIWVHVPAASGNNPGVVVRTYSLAGYKMDFTGPSHNNYNTLTTNMSAIVDSSAGTATIGPWDSIVNIKITFHAISPSYARGYFGTITNTYNSQANFPLFNRVIAGSLNLNSIAVNMTLTNYFGVDAQVNLSQLTSYNSHTNTTVNLNDPQIINNVININRATETFNASNPVIPSVQTFTIPATSNILQWVDNLPNEVKYNLSATTDPLGNVSGYNDFAYAGPGLVSNLNISIPLNLIATNLTLEDTLNVNFASGGNQAKNVKSGTFTLYADNGFPFSAGMQVYLMDSLYHITDSLMITGPQTIAAGNVNSNGIVTSPQTSVLTMAVNETKMQLLLKTKHIIMYSRFNMGCLSCLPPQYRKIYSYNLLNVKLVGNFTYRING